ncbi:hypothetical protein HCX50_04115 [Microbacterium oxydans]|uniref:hypothetical protein n=1 Tax=Microbacterium sp. B19(2022) TaxID=2914045 RepID=UPI00143090E5|nr:hypothetical protein [Microbacterium sp. B19(2022)]NJI58611.1 hypothetical protein [Microbacterium sp. B19(2022)]
MRAGAEWFSGTVRTLAEAQHPILTSFTRETIEEFPDFDEDDAESLDFRQFAHRHELEMSLDATLAFDVTTILAIADEVGNNLGRQQSKDMIRMISDNATAAGNVVTIDPTNPVEQYIAGLAKVDIEFDEDGNHNMQIIASKEFLQQLSDNPPTPEQQERIDAIFALKKEEQDARRRNRRLP